MEGLETPKLMKHPKLRLPSFGSDTVEFVLRWMMLESEPEHAEWEASNVRTVKSVNKLHDLLHAADYLGLDRLLSLIHI